jgi:molecular chaperone HscB
MAKAGSEFKTQLSPCVYCGADPRDQHFCGQCGKLLPLAPGTDYFSFFGLPRKLTIDRSALEKNFYALSRRLHPDYFTGATSAERQASVDQSSMLNDAYRTLRDPVARVRYLLTLEGFKEAEKKAPPELLEEIFELNLQIEELKAAKKTGDAEEAGEARKSLELSLAGLREKLDEIDSKLADLFPDWDESPGDRTAERGQNALSRMSELLSHRSYVSNLISDIDEEL